MRRRRERFQRAPPCATRAGSQQTRPDLGHGDAAEDERRARAARSAARPRSAARAPSSRCTRLNAALSVLASFDDSSQPSSERPQNLLRHVRRRLRGPEGRRRRRHQLSSALLARALPLAGWRRGDRVVVHLEPRRITRGPGRTETRCRAKARELKASDLKDQPRGTSAMRREPRIL